MKFKFLMDDTPIALNKSTCLIHGHITLKPPSNYKLDMRTL